MRQTQTSEQQERPETAKLNLSLDGAAETVFGSWYLVSGNAQVSCGIRSLNSQAYSCRI
jgi:hypothetical protein